MSAEPSPEDEPSGPIHRVVHWFRGLASSTQDRIVGLVLAVPSGGVLGTALWLDADPAGVGTHRQLGLGGCTILTSFGVPCPMCGMTTTFTHLAHLDLVAGVVNQPFGLLLFGGTAAAFCLGLAELLAPRTRWRRAAAVVDRHEGWIAAVLLIGMFGGWAYKWAAMDGYLSFVP